jgi:hypothetical protein
MHSDVNLQLFTDDPKALTLFLLNRRYRFEETTRSLSRGGRMEPFPQISFDVDDVTITMTVLDRDDERWSPKPREDQAPQRARVEQVEAMLAATSGA